MNQEHSGFDSYGMRPATLEERLERIQGEIAKFGRDYVPKTRTMEALYGELLNRESILMEQIGSQAQR